jgi:hypothetical protein
MEQPPSTHQVLISLYDHHLEREIMGVRLVRHAVAKNYPFRAVQGCETDQMWRAMRDGHRTVALLGLNVLPAGEHGTQFTLESAYERYRTLFRRARKDEGIEWVVPYAQVFAKRLHADSRSVDFWALLGAIAGTLSPLDVEEGEKTADHVHEEFRHLSALFERSEPCA